MSPTNFIRFAFLLICNIPFFAFAQCPGSGELNITATLYTQENGLTSNMLIGTAKDSTGYLYFLGLDGKWLRFDGTNFRVINNINNIQFYNYSSVNYATSSYELEFFKSTFYKSEINQTQLKNKWGLKGDSLIYSSYNTKRKEIYRIPKEITAASLISFFPQGENCWLTTRNNIFKFNLRSKKFENIPINIADEHKLHLSNSFIPWRAGNSSFIVSGNFLMKFDSAKKAFEKFSTLLQVMPADNFKSVLIMDNYLFVAESNTVIAEINLSNGKLEKFDVADYSNIKNTSALKINSLLSYRDYLLIGTSNAGLFIYNRCTKSMQHFLYEKLNSNDALANSIEWLAVHDENVIWMQTNAGLIKLEVNNQFMKTYMPSSVKSGGVCNNCNNVRAIYSNNNNELLIGSYEGIYKFNIGSGQFENLLSTIDKKPVWKHTGIGAITGDKEGNIFIANWSDDGILLLNNEKKKLINLLPIEDNPEFLHRNIRCLFYDSHQVLWAGTNDGILRITNINEFNDNNYTGKIAVSNQFPGSNSSISKLMGDCFSIIEDTKENIWIGTFNGLYVYNYKTNAVVKYVHINEDNNSLSNNDVRSVYIVKDGDVWVGTSSGGLNRFDNNTKTFTSFTTENGLPNNSIYTILEDKSGFLWLGTNAGLCRFNKADHSVRNYTPRDGIQNYEFNTNAVCKTADGKFCFGGRTGFNVFHPDSMNITFTPPKVVITKLKIFDKEFSVTDSVLELTYEQNSFTFDFAALNYYRTSDNQYAYMMEGVDKDWIKSGNRQYTSYTNLSPGAYTFKVHAANYTGAWNNKITTLKFVINAAWYNTWWFRLFFLFLIVAGIYGLYKYRMRQVLKLYDVRNSIASDLHDEIGSTLGSISLSSAIIERKLKEGNTDVSKLLQQVSNNASNMMEALSDIVWTINSKNDRFSNVVNRMRAFAVEMLEPNNVTIEFNVSEENLNINLDMQQRKNLYLIFKEAINNIMKYADCKNVDITISKQGNKMFVMEIKDDGKGFDLYDLNREERSLSGNGIRNMKKRAKELGGELNIYSTKEKGTILNLKFII